MEAPDDFVSRFDEMFGVAYRAAFAVLGERTDAEDCAQDTLAKALIKWRTVKLHPVPWAARVSTNAAIDRWRKRQRSVLSAEPHEAEAPTSALSDKFLAGQRDDLVRALRALPRRQREAVVLRHLLDLSEAETATALKCSIGTIKSATSRGLAQLRTQLGDLVPTEATEATPG